MKKTVCFLLIFTTFFVFGLNTFAINNINIGAESQLTVNEFDVDAKSAILMEANTGKILYAKNEIAEASPASVTKIMTLLIVMESINDGRISLDDKICISAYAASMGGSQVFLEEGEEMNVEELIKCTVIASANDAAVALAEHIGGSEKNFVNMMNKRASELNMKNTNFENVTGLDDTTKNHFTSAKDIAIMSQELIKNDLILKYSTLWQDTIRGGEFTLTNTNRLVRYYDGCNGLKTGSTDKAGYCISATAKRGDLQLIAVVMGAETRDSRNATARTLLDYGFSNYGIYKNAENFIENINIFNGTKGNTAIYASEFSAVVPKNMIKKVELIYEIPEYVDAPLKPGDIVGRIVYKLEGEQIGSSDIFVKEEINKITVFDIFKQLIKNIINL